MVRARKLLFEHAPWSARRSSVTYTNEKGLYQAKHFNIIPTPPTRKAKGRKKVKVKRQKVKVRENTFN
jgi:hypothetical protein